MKNSRTKNNPQLDKTINKNFWTFDVLRLKDLYLNVSTRNFVTIFILTNHLFKIKVRACRYNPKNSGTTITGFVDIPRGNYFVCLTFFHITVCRVLIKINFNQIKKAMRKL